MIYLKIILAFLLSAVPFLYVSFIKPRQNTSPRWRNLLAAIGSLGINKLPQVKAAKAACIKFLYRIYEGIKRSDNFRKFFTLLTLLVMIAVQYVDFSASADVAAMIRDTTMKGSATAAQAATEGSRIIAVYGPIMSKPHATLLAACISMILFVFKCGDWLLTQLHHSSRLFGLTAVVALIFLFGSPRYIIVAETICMMLMAALIYPDRMMTENPKGRKGIPLEKNSISLKDAA